MNTELLLRYATRMPALPKLVQEIIQAFNLPNVDADLIAGKVMLDQVLTSKILRLANSSFYGGRRKIESANDAVVLLGFDALRNLVIASAVAGAFNKVAGHIDFTAVWRKSYMVAALAKWLIRRCCARGPTPDTAFTTGLLYLNQERQTYAQTARLTPVPLVHLPAESLRPSRQALEKVNASYL